MMANGSYFHVGGEGFAAHLAQRGIETFVLDWRGHGKSVPPSPREQPGWSFDDYVELDLPAAISTVCATAGIAPERLAYLGHSLGGLVALAGFGTGVAAVPRCLSVWSSSIWLTGRRGSLKRRISMGIYELSTKPLGYAPIRRLRFGSDDEPRAYVEQLAGWAKRGAWTSRTGVDYMATVHRVSCPTLVVTGAGDPLSSPLDVNVLAARLPDVRRFRIVGKRNGDAIDADHFTLLTKSALAPLWDEAVEFLAED